MLAENYYMNSRQEDELGEFVWEEMETLDGTKRIKRYLDNNKI